ncbi:LCP family protein [Streptomyces sp. NBC_01381]|uniref:LCP family protein n=1 Tax=Streptomyces sp. NBC_01381 TaxID=2903845 RepID=UPI002256AA1E|nr:LCP family protein [Streptomyces sp. NBC_01381]MCX4670477.1 LCP family protein [Streptomyces sp. NBC_01381]
MSRGERGKRRRTRAESAESEPLTGTVLAQQGTTEYGVSAYEYDHDYGTAGYVTTDIAPRVPPQSIPYGGRGDYSVDSGIDYGVASEVDDERDDEGDAADDGPGRGRRRSGIRRSWPRRIMRTLLVLVAVALVTSVSTYVWADGKLERDVDLGKVEDRPSGGEGTNYLIVGSDSRDGLSGKDKKDLHTGSAEGRRTDSMILLHTGRNGSTMMSLPRDSWVTVPPFTRPETGKRPAAEKNKLNAAFSEGGPELLVRTVEFNTGLKIDHYAEIGFAGFVNVVDSVGGVEMCLDKAIKDKSSGADLKKGCQTLDGTEALAFVRQRHQESEGDLGRSRNQQKFLSALAEQAAAPGTVFNPAKLYSTMGAGLDTLIVDKDLSLQDLTAMFQAMQGVAGGAGRQINVPVASLGFPTSKGSAVKWDEAKAKKLFGELRDDRPVTFQEKK